MQQVSLTTIVLTKNAAETLEATLRSLAFSESILIIDDGSIDSTLDIASLYKARVIKAPSGSTFAEKRTFALTHVKTKWFIYIDSDEVVTSELAARIAQIVEANTPSAYRVKRRNHFLGTEMYPDYVDRLFHTSVLKGWHGSVHESPKLTEPVKVIEESLIHHTHRSIESMLAKTNEWSEYEAQLRIEAHHPPMAWWRLIRIGLTVWWQQYIGKGLWQYGRAGLFEAYFQMVDKLIVYTKLWELQHTV